MSTKSTEEAAKILLHYIEVALTNAGVSIDSEMRAEFEEVVEAFRYAGARPMIKSELNKRAAEQQERDRVNALLQGGADRFLDDIAR